MARTAAERGSIGGRTTFQRHGSVHMEATLRAGFWVTVLRYYGGDVQAYMDALRARQSKGEHDPRLGCGVQRPKQTHDPLTVRGGRRAV
ncbi:hypothetical protein [Deinococcus phoenicis]|uniref:hypothetical protein n=1 Tax=Deinococcus phoenicis TaxID=1476583 RepID=UPI0005578066|nr:hypothetical protein [Deinococcus phoenicis]